MKKLFLTLVAGLCISTGLFANGDVQQDDKKQNYANSKFVWTQNYVVEGANAAMAPTTEEIVTTCLSKDGKPLTTFINMVSLQVHRLLKRLSTTWPWTK